MTGLAPVFITQSHERITTLTTQGDWETLRDLAGTWSHLACLTLTTEHADPEAAVSVARDWARLAVAADRAKLFVAFPPQDAAAIQAAVDASLKALETELAL